MLYLTLLVLTTKLAGHRILFQVIVLPILYMLYQTYVFFGRMYRVSKWTSESARFVRTVTVSFWAMELALFAIFTYLSTFKSLMPRYGFNHAEVVLSGQITTNAITYGFAIAAILTLTLLCAPILKKTKRPGLLAIALIMATAVLFSTFTGEYAATLAAFT